ncbi:hypothetical protein, partial [Treponema endosymbiont of Eucomonympha sp.]|uniref:hypothetical protein n=1 Tax=Treponema endosymbiont of Eucomonympha sp. TaxID=1580831 RepID=UPI001EE6B721
VPARIIQGTIMADTESGSGLPDERRQEIRTPEGGTVIPTPIEFIKKAYRRAAGSVQLPAERYADR